MLRVSSSSTPKVTYLKDYQVPSFLIDHVDLIFELDENKTTVHEHLLVRRNPESLDKTTEIKLDGVNLSFISLKVNDQAWPVTDYEVQEDGLLIRNVPDNCELVIKHTINPSANTALEGLYVSRGTYTTHCEAQGFRAIAYFFDRPDIMATYTTTIIADPAKCPVMLSNGNQTEEGELIDGRAFVKWDDPFKKPSYLYALVAGNLAYKQDFFMTASGRKVQIRIYAEANQLDRCQHAMDALKAGMKWDEENYGRECDLEFFNLVAISDFNMGAMENKGLNIFNSRSILASPATALDARHILIFQTVVHEYFHNWTGNRVTLRDWCQVAVKEGLTSKREISCTADLISAATRAEEISYLKAQQFKEDAGPLAHPVQPQSYISPDNCYTTTVYNKGAELFEMLQTWLGKEGYRAAMDLYFSRHDGQAVTVEQFVKAMEDASKQDLSQFLVWFKQAGTPRVEGSAVYDAATQVYKLKMKQSTPPTPGQADKAPLPIPVRVGLLDRDGNAIAFSMNDSQALVDETVLKFTEAEQEFEFRNVTSAPVPSLFRNFSAPVLVNFDYSEQDLALIARSDKDSYNRLDAMTRYTMLQINNMIAQAQHWTALKVSIEYINTFGELLRSDMPDKWLLAQMLEIPSVTDIAGQMDKIDIDTIVAVRNEIMLQLSKSLGAWLVIKYSEYFDEDKTSEKFDIKQAGIRRVKNLCLTYLLQTREESVQRVACSQFDVALTSNLTNTVAVLNDLDMLQESDRERLLQQFDDAWRDDHIVMIQWFRVKVLHASNTKAVREIFMHPAFDFKNPNTLRSLLAGFTENIACFHDVTGAGYRLLAEIILELDTINPKTAASAVDYLAQWERYAGVRKTHMRDALQTIMDHDISPDLYELVSKCLQNSLVLRDKVALKPKPVGVLFKPRVQVDEVVKGERQLLTASK